ncbi:hypothetical protein GCM10029992_64960 [Glycomyces albus]
MSPTFERFPRFNQDHEKLQKEQQARFKKAVAEFVEDLRTGGSIRPGLRIKRVQGAEGVYEISWAPDGRATWEYGEEKIPGEPHIKWRRIGTHDIFKNP